MIRLGVDIGGTFTDFVMAGDGVSGLAVHKRLTTPDDPSRAVLEGAEALLARHGLGMREVAEIVHGTTLVTNAVIERRGAVTGMLVTRGFADALEMGLEQRYDLFDLRLRFAPPVVGRRCRAEIDERVAHDGAVVAAIDLAATRDAIAALIDAHGIEALAVCFLNAYANPVHEQAVFDLAARAFPSLHVTASADVAPQMREFERWTTATVNAYCQPRFDRYLAALEEGLAARGFAGRFLMMSSSGGAVTPQTARRYPVRMLESGPAAGVLMSAEHGRRLGIADLLSFDLGGTTAKGSIVRDGRPVRRYAMEVARVHGHKRGSGLALQMPGVDMTEIGSGGGSVAHVDERLLLRVGPRSTGAIPGPACYGRGGTLATLTDANLTLGYLDPGFFLGGAMALDRARARAAIADAIGGPLRLDDMRAAWRMHAVERSFDCRRATIVAFGGGGPIHATGVARKLGAPRVVLPVGAGVMSALGLLASPLAFEVARSRNARLDALGAAQFAQLMDEVAGEAAAFLTAAGLAGSDIVVDRRVDLRHRGQGHELEIALPPGEAPAESFARLPGLFAGRYRAMFGVDALDEPLELVTLTAEARSPVPDLPRAEPDAGAAGSSFKGERLAYVPERTRFESVPVHDRYRLRSGDRIPGPALIEERESTCLLRDGDVAAVDAQLNLVVDIRR